MAEHIETLAAAVDLDRSRERNRGRNAEDPRDIPREGWKDIAWRVYKCVDEHRLGLIAAGVTFYVILALFPALTALVSVYGLLTDPRSISQQLTNLYLVLPEEAIVLIRGQLDALTSAPPSKLGFGFVVSLLVAMWSVNNAVKAVFEGLNITYREREKRGVLWLNGISFAFAIGSILMAMMYMIAIAVVPLVLNFIGFGVVAEMLIRFMRWPVLMVMSALAIALLNRYGPSREHARWSWVTPGSLFVMAAWVVMSSAFSFYLSNFANYDKTYGALGTAIAVMVWVWCSTYILLVGAAVNAEMEHQTAKDTTVGTAKPLGTRGAKMADTVGKGRGRK
ncbi:MAG: YihY/virulence factor BrkB family protein [Alphaproteobacteria bacterium]|nr:MAG: YihY/virulence factor BrkB family protein [Alphaproteobacteria bacterium]